MLQFEKPIYKITEYIDDKNLDTEAMMNDMLKYKGMNVLSSAGIYFDYTAKGLGNKALSPSKAEIIKQTADYAEVLYTNTSDDLRFQHGYILRKGVSGVYMYVIVNGTPSSSSVQLQEARVCTRTNGSFLNGYIDDTMRGKMPTVNEMLDVESNGTDNPAYVQDATYQMPDGSIYTKYNWAQYVVRDSVHGLMHTNGYYGIWNIPCSSEWYPGGPMKQELTAHATGKSPITIQMLQGEHMGTASMYFNDGERKIYGPFFLYLNFTTTKDQEELIADAKKVAAENGIRLVEGVYVGTQGPTFETPAEYRYFHRIGGDAVGMSTVPEVIVARHSGIRCFGMSVITDLGVEGIVEKVSHEEVQKAAAAAEPKMTFIMKELINKFEE